MLKLDRLLPLALALLCGCASDRYSFASTTAPGDASEVLVLGRKPRVSIESRGPGRLRVDFDSPDDACDDSVIMDGGVVVRRLPGPVRVRLVPLGSARVDWRLVAHRAGGLSVDLLAP